MLRGKKLITTNPKENFTKVPNSLLFAKNLKPVEKLILIQLHYYPSDWILAYTRMAADLSIRKDTLIKHWYSLIDMGVIISTDESYTINYTMLDGTKNVPEPDGTNYEKRTYDGTKNVPSDGTKFVPTMVRKTYLNGTQGVPIEEDTKEEDLLNKTKEEEKKQKKVIEGNRGELIKPALIAGISSIKKELTPLQERLNSFDAFVKIYNKEKLIKLQSLRPYEFADIFNHLDYSVAITIHSRIKNTNWHLIDDVSSIKKGDILPQANDNTSIKTIDSFSEIERKKIMEFQLPV